MAHYANAFTLTSERCFRLVQAENGTGHAQHCPYLTVWRGRFKDGAGKWVTQPGPENGSRRDPASTDPAASQSTHRQRCHTWMPALQPEPS
jgi:hypothetical protein